MKPGLTDAARASLERAQTEAGELMRAYVGTEHLLLGILYEETSVASSILRAHGVVYRKTREMANENVGSFVSDKPREMTPGLAAVVEEAANEARKAGRTRVGTEHLLAALLSEHDSTAVKLIIAQNAGPNEIRGDIISFFSESEGAPRQEEKPKLQAKTENDTVSLLTYGRDLTELARRGKLGVVVGREKETERVMRILSRKTKNNPCLVGEPGVGKTAVVEGLCLKMVKGEVPLDLRDKTVIMLDIGSMISGAKYRGEFEERLKRVTDEARRNRDIILFIDELHTIVGAGAAEGAVDAANILKPMLARGEIRVIGATTSEEYRKHIERDAALERRFQPVTVDEPDEEETKKILFALRPEYELHHGVSISDGAIAASVALSQRYLPDRFLPDKAIDLMDEAASAKRISFYGPSQEQSALEGEIKLLSQKRENAVISRDFALASLIRDELIKKREALGEQRNKIESSLKSSVVTETDVAKILEAWTKIPTERLVEKESERLLSLEKKLSERIIGQDEAIKKLALAVRRGRTGIASRRRPVCSLLFTGPTGVGKTELALAAANALFGSDDAIIRLDMSEYSEKHSVSKLIGSPPGYVGYGDGGQLTEKIRRRPYSIVLFDEIEKAHPELFDMLLQILDDGHLTDSSGRRADFSNAIIIMTSNAGYTHHVRKSGFSAGGEAEEEKKSALDALGQIFKPEFLGRIDDIIVFSPLTDGDMNKIAQRLLSEVAENAVRLGITVRFDPSVAQLAQKEGLAEHKGARPLRRAVTRICEDALAAAILEGRAKPGDELIAVIENGAAVLKHAANK